MFEMLQINIFLIVVPFLQVHTYTQLTIYSITYNYKNLLTEEVVVNFVEEAVNFVLKSKKGR